MGGEGEGVLDWEVGGWGERDGDGEGESCTGIVGRVDDVFEWESCEWTSGLYWLSVCVERVRLFLFFLFVKKAHLLSVFFFFSQRRIKIFLFVLLRDIEVSIDPNIEIEKKVKWVVHPSFSRLFELTCPYSSLPFS